MKLKISVLVVLLMVSSCAKDKNKQQIENFKTEEHTNDEEIDSLIKNEIPSNLEESDSDLDKEGFFTYIINKLKLDNYVVSYALSVEGYNFFGENSKNYIISSFDRSSINIEKFFGDIEIEIIARLLKMHDIYYKSGSDLMVKGLLESYKELKDDEEFLNSVFEDDENSFELLQTKFSDEVEDLIDFNKHQVYDNNSQIDNRLFMVYSFWVRRHHEGNAKIVYSLLKKLDAKINNRYNGNILDFDREQVISRISSDKFSLFNFDKEIFNFLFEEMKVASKQFEYIIADFSIFITRTEEEWLNRYSDSNNYESKLNHLYSNFDRSPENITKILNDDILNHIAFLFNNKILLKDQRLYKVLKGLLLTYDEMNNAECERLYELLSNEEVFKYYIISDAFKEKVSDKVKNFITEDGYFKHNESETDYGYGKRAFYLYSFWARRYNENNKEVVFEILKKLDKKIK